MIRALLIVGFAALFIIILVSVFAPKEIPEPLLMELKEEYPRQLPPKVDHSKFAELNREFTSPKEVTEQCEKCHNLTADEIMHSNHWNWEREEYVEGKGIVYYGKRNAVNNFCISSLGNELVCAKCHIGYGIDAEGRGFTDKSNIDCLVCHDNTETYAKAPEKGGLPLPTLDLKKIAQSVGRPKRSNCGVCHFYGGGGNNVKHGDLESALFEPTKDVDIHMGVDSVNLQCVDCHKTEYHQISGKLYSLSSMNLRRVYCSDCHTDTPHDKEILNEHTLKVACQTCHIPIYAKVHPTKIFWDWSTAGKLKNGKPYVEEDENGNHIYMSIKGSFKWGKNLKPDYIWFNGTATHYMKDDKIEDPSKPVILNKLYGSYDDEFSKIIPVKIHTAIIPYDPVNKILITPKLYAPKKGEGAFWKDFDWQKAAEVGMKESGLPFSGKISFIKTKMYWPINHMVSSKEESLKCEECHTRNNSRLKGLTDFYMPGRDYIASVDNGGKILWLLVLIGGIIHGALRIYFSRKFKKKAETTGKLKQVLIYKGFERFWHWMQALFILFLAFTGFEIHGWYTFFEYEFAVLYHSIVAYFLLGLIVFAIFWHLTTGEYKQYIPTFKNIKAQLEYYVFGIFRNAPHPTKKTVLSKLNPLQKLTYFILKVFLIPLIVFSGLLYMFYRYPSRHGIESINMHSLKIIAVAHTVGAILLVAFVILHVYLITTGRTVLTNLKAMLTGYEEVEEEE